MSAEAPIVVRNLNHAFGKGVLRKQILFDISTEIPRGEIVIVTGPSGSGKTTMLTLVGALRSAREGSVRILGEELCGAGAAALERARRRIGFIFQQHNLLQALTAVQNVELGLRVTQRYSPAEENRIAVDMLHAVGLGERLHYKGEQLSGGQRQRVAIARALASQPDILLADEPTASLDKESGREVVDRIKTLAKEKGTTILLVTHDNRILDVADRIVHLEDGRLSTFTDAVIANNQLMMKTLAENRQRQSLDSVVDRLDEKGFRELLQQLTDESQRFMEATALASDAAFQSMLEQGLFAFTRKFGQLLDAERASLFVVEAGRKTLRLRVAQDLPEDIVVRIPIGSGIAGSSAESGKSIRVDDAYADPRFNRDVDLRSGFRTRTILCIPLKNRRGEVFGVAQLLNRKDGRPFDAEDEKRFEHFIESIGVILETLESLATGTTPAQQAAT
ncbi:MAG TPA: ATP-binding cassette domain-containing protein [Candidatus Binatia bacterium]|jgi:putative ABC transport system ATP-binding protein